MGLISYYNSFPHYHFDPCSIIHHWSSKKNPLRMIAGKLHRAGTVQITPQYLSGCRRTLGAGSMVQCSAITQARLKKKEGWMKNNSGVTVCWITCFCLHFIPCIVLSNYFHTYEKILTLHLHFIIWNCWKSWWTQVLLGLKMGAASDTDFSKLSFYYLGVGLIVGTACGTFPGQILQVSNIFLKIYYILLLVAAPDQ